MKKGVKIQQPSWIFPTTFLLPFKHAWPAVGCNIHSDTRALTISSESCLDESRGVPNRGQQLQTTNIFHLGYRKKTTTTYPNFHPITLMEHELIPRFMGFRGRRFAFFLHAFGPKKFLKFLISSAPPRCIPIEVI